MPNVPDSTEMARRGRLGGIATSVRHDAVAITTPARAAFKAKFANEPDPDAALREHMIALARRSAEARRQRPAVSTGAIASEGGHDVA